MCLRNVGIPVLVKKCSISSVHTFPFQNMFTVKRKRLSYTSIKHQWNIQIVPWNWQRLNKHSFVCFVLEIFFTWITKYVALLFKWCSIVSLRGCLEHLPIERNVHPPPCIKTKTGLSVRCMEERGSYTRTDTPLISWSVICPVIKQ